MHRTKVSFSDFHAAHTHELSAKTKKQCKRILEDMFNKGVYISIGDTLCEEVTYDTRHKK